MRRKEKTRIKIENKKILRRTWKEFFIKAITSIMMRGILLIIPIWYSNAIDFASKGNFEKAYHIIIIALLVYIGYYIIESINSVFYWKLYNRLYKRYTKLATYSTFQNSLYSLSRFSLGEYENILNNDIDIICSFYSNGVIRVVQIFEIFIIFGYFLSINLFVFGLTAFICFMMILVYALCSGKIQKLNSYRKMKLDKKTATIQEIFLGIKEIKGLHVLDYINGHMKEKSIDYLNAYAKYDCFVVNVKVFVLAMIQSARFILVFFGLFLMSKGEMTVGTIMLIYNYYQKIVDNFEVVNTVSIELQNLKVSFSRFNKILEYSHNQEDNGNTKISNFKGNISFQDVLYGNRNDPILNVVNFTIPANQITVITGKAGSGKTGIIDLLLKLNQKHNGEIQIDETPIEQIDGRLYYNLISSVRKIPSFFDGSIKENLMLVEQDFNKIVEICKKLQIHDDILRLSKGYDTPIISKEDNISNNLKQLIAIARVFLKQSKIMLFDEAISVLEKESSQIVMNLLQELKGDHTIVIISREKEIVQSADQIIVLDHNEIAEVGTHRKLLKNKNVYYDLYGG